MQAKLIQKLQELATKIALLDNNTDVATLKDEAKMLYEKLTVLDFVNTNISDFKNEVVGTPTTIQEEIITKTVEEEAAKVTPISIEKPVAVTPPKPVQEIPKEPITQTPTTPEVNTFLSEEDVTTIFDKDQWVVEKKEPIIEKPKETPITQAGMPKAEVFQAAKKPLNRSLIPQTITVGLNDRIAFVKHLFNHSQADFNRVLSQLNTIDTEQAAYDFINKMVKPEYNWEGEEEYEVRFLDLIARRFS